MVDERKAENAGKSGATMGERVLSAPPFQGGNAGSNPAGDANLADRLPDCDTGCDTPAQSGSAGPSTIAALFVQRGGCYWDLPGIDPWDEERDARTYPGPWPVVAHPPCERWGRYWHGGPSARVRRKLGDDGGCFASALASVRRWGGVLEHPQASHAWRAHGLTPPPWGGHWVVADELGGWTCCVEQGHYGHRARKATWLYAIGVELPSLVWGPSASGARLDYGYHSADERKAAKVAGTYRKARRLTRRENAATPPAFRDVLIAMARTAPRPPSEARR